LLTVTTIEPEIAEFLLTLPSVGVEELEIGEREALRDDLV
jgi:hypothetical protein